MPKKAKKVSKKQKYKKVPYKIPESVLARLEKKLDEIIALEKKQLREQKEFEELEEEQLEEVEKFETLEKKQLKHLEELEHLEELISKEVRGHPLKRITYKDVAKGVIGAFIGIVSHYAFFEGAHIAENISTARATLILVTSFLVGSVLLYATGYRRVKEIRLLHFFPARILVIYFTAIFVVFFVLAIFGLIEEHNFLLVYKQISVVSLPAVIGASAADLIGD